MHLPIQEGYSMNEIKILKWALDRVVIRGFQGDDAFDDWYNGRDWDPNTPYKLKRSEYYDVIFSHEFAKLFWGYEPYYMYESKYQHVFENHQCKVIETRAGGIWEHHLQRMVLENNPIDYLVKFYEKHKL